MARTSGGLVLAKVADTGAGGFALQSGATPTILTWTAPSDGNLHIAVVAIGAIATTTATGGAVMVEINGNAVTNSSGTNSAVLSPNLAASSAYYVPGDGGINNTYIVPPGGVFNIYQSTFLTAGAVTVYAQIWAA